MKSPVSMLAVMAICCVIPVVLLKAESAMIIDHRCTDLGEAPESYLKKAQAKFRIAYGHTSHGSQIVSGMQALEQRNPELFSFGADDGEGLFLLDRKPKGDLGNPNRTTWAERTRELLNNNTHQINVVMWSWCGQVSRAKEEDIQTYLDLMSQLETDFPQVTFIYMTGHLDGSGVDGNLNRRNEQIRDYCRKHGKILFDFADIESYDPDGAVNYMALGARDTCDYRDGGKRINWADAWLEKHPDSDITLPKSAAHSRPLNAALKGRAFWWMMARMAGWNGQA